MKKQTKTLVDFYRKLKLKKARLLEVVEKRPYRQRGTPKPPRFCFCGKEMNQNAKLCSECLPSTHGEFDGIKFKPKVFGVAGKDIKNPGRKCRWEQRNCEIETNRFDGYCFKHQPKSKNKKYTVRVPEEKPHVLPSLDEFKKRLKGSPPLH